MRSGFSDSLMDGENPLIDQTGPAQSWMYGIGLNGTLVSKRASFNVNFNGQDSYSTINNLFNRPAYSGFGSILTSDFFLKPTVASGLRPITFNTNVFLAGC